MNEMICPDPNVLTDYVLGKTSEAEMVGITSHVEACPTCQTKLETLDGLSDTVIAYLRQAIPGEVDSDDSLLKEVLARVESVTSGPGSAADNHAEGVVLPMQIGQYQLLEKLGEGGMGTVFKAFHTKLKRPVAVKLLLSYRQRSPRRSHAFIERWRPLDESIIPISFEPTMPGKPTASSFLSWSLSKGSPYRHWCPASAPSVSPIPVRLFGKLLSACSTPMSMALSIGMSNHRISCSRRRARSRYSTWAWLAFRSKRPPAATQLGAGRSWGVPITWLPNRAPPPKTLMPGPMCMPWVAFFIAFWPEGRHSATSGTETFCKRSLRRPTKTSCLLNQIRPDVPIPLATVLSKMLAKSPEAVIPRLSRWPSY